jgi:hypothetical protein
MKFKEAVSLGVVVALASMLVTFVIGKFLSGMFNLTNAFATIPLTSGLSPTIYNSVAGIFTSIGFSLASFLILLVSSIVLVYFGGLLFEVLGIKASGWMKTFYTILLGTALGYIVFVGFVFKIGTMGVVGAVIYAAIVAFVAGAIYPWVQKTLNL